MTVAGVTTADATGIQLSIRDNEVFDSETAELANQLLGTSLQGGDEVDTFDLDWSVTTANNTELTAGLTFVFTDTSTITSTSFAEFSPELAAQAQVVFFVTETNAQDQTLYQALGRVADNEEEVCPGDDCETAITVMRIISGSKAAEEETPENPP